MTTQETRIIEYRPQSITVPTPDGPREIEAMVAVGTGLAYNFDGGEQERGYTLTTLNGDGYGLIRHTRVTTERVAQLWLEGVSKLTDWTKDKRAIVSDLYTRYGNLFGIRMQIKDCLQVACDTYIDEIIERQETTR